MAEESAKLRIPYIASAQAQKHVTHNEGVTLLDTLVQLSVLDKDLLAPPGSPTEGDTYIVAGGGGTATGAWVGWEQRVARFIDAEWRSYLPGAGSGAGWLAWVLDEDRLYVFDGASWATATIVFGEITDGTILKLGVNTAADDTNRLAVKSDAILFSHDDVTPGTGDLRVTLNKSAVDKDAGFTFQDGFSTRALFGLLGDDNFAVKVSPDGSAFYTGLVIDKDDGAVDHPEGSKFEATTNFENYIAANTWTKIQFNTTNHNDQADFVAGSNRLVAPFAGYYVIGAKWRFKANAAVPTQLLTRLYKNGAALAYTEAHSWGTVVTLASMLQTATVLKLAASDYVEVFAYMATNDGYVDDDNAVFYGCRVA